MNTLVNRLSSLEQRVTRLETELQTVRSTVPQAGTSAVPTPSTTAPVHTSVSTQLTQAVPGTGVGAEDEFFRKYIQDNPWFSALSTKRYLR